MRHFWILIMCCLLCVHINAQSFEFVVAELNTENFFDIQHDDGKNDYDFLPNSGRLWTRGKFWNKLQNISKEIYSLTPSIPADLVALTEVENDSVLNYLTRRSLLRRAGYKYVMTESNDERGIDVALLYQPETFKLLRSESIRPKLNGKDIVTRDVLHVVGRLYNDDTIHVFVCHLSSKIGGKVAEKYRMAEVRTIYDTVKKIQNIEHNPKIIITGDFNDNPSSRILKRELNVKRIIRGERTEKEDLYNLSYNSKSGDINGTYKYDGRWEMLDQCIVTGNLLDSTGCFYTSPDRFKIWAPDFLLEKDENDTKLKPKRTYNGYRYNGGFSDHLPIITKFTIKLR